MAKQSTHETNKDPLRDNEGAEKFDRHVPPAGPHASEHLTDRDKTPGTGALTEERNDGDVDAATG